MKNIRKFERGLDPVQLKEVGTFLESAIGEKIIKDDRFDICIRNNYINIYQSGCSILKYEPKKNCNEFKIHKKYLYETCSEDDNYEILENKNGDLYAKEISFIRDIIDAPNENFKRYLEKPADNGINEKKYIAEYLKKIDQETIFNGFGNCLRAGKT